MRSLRLRPAHRVELAAAARVAALFEAREHRVMTIDLRAFGASAPHGRA